MVKLNGRQRAAACALLAFAFFLPPSLGSAQTRGAQQRAYSPPPQTYTAPRATYTPQRPSYQSPTANSYRSVTTPQYSQGFRPSGYGSPNTFRSPSRSANDNTAVFRRQSNQGTAAAVFKNSGANDNMPRLGRNAAGGSPFKSMGINRTGTSAPALMNNPFASNQHGRSTKSFAQGNSMGSTVFKSAQRSSNSHSGVPPGSSLAKVAPLTGLFNAHASGKARGGSGGGGGGGDDEDPPPSPALKPDLVSPDPGF